MATSGDEEYGRAFSRPTGSTAVLSAFYVELVSWTEVEGFSRRLRSAIDSCLQVAGQSDFDADEISEHGIPEWMTAATTSDLGKLARTRYSLHRGDETWTMQDVLFSFDPQQRSWWWWDVTSAGGNIVHVWVDSRGEAVYSCEELRWILYLSGAHTIVGPVLLPESSWIAQRSAGL